MTVHTHTWDDSEGRYTTELELDEDTRPVRVTFRSEDVQTFTDVRAVDVAKPVLDAFVREFARTDDFAAAHALDAMYVCDELPDVTADDYVIVSDGIMFAIGLDSGITTED